MAAFLPFEKIFEYSGFTQRLKFLLPNQGPWTAISSPGRNAGVMVFESAVDIVGAANIEARVRILDDVDIIHELFQSKDRTNLSGL